MLIDALISDATELIKKKSLDQAKRVLNDGLKIDSSHPKLTFLLGQVMLQKKDFEPAIRIFKSLSEQHDSIEYLNFYAQALECNSNHKEALDVYLRSIKRDGEQADILFKIACILIIDKQFDLALKFLTQAKNITELPGLYEKMGFALAQLGDYKNSYICYQKALDKDPQDKKLLCSMISLAQKDPKKNLEHIQSLVLKYHDNFLVDIESLKINHSLKLFGSKTKLNIGFVSGNFRKNPLSFNFLPVLELMNKDQFDLFFYYSKDIVDGFTRRFQKLAAKFEMVTNLDYRDIATRILTDKIDILINLDAFEDASQLEVFKLKPAPVQIAHYAATTTLGMPEIDYMLADRFVVKPGEEIFFSEKIYRFPRTYFPVVISDLAQPVRRLPMMSKGYITFGVTSNLHRISHEMLGTWVHVLKKSPKSKLVIDAKDLSSPSCQKLITNFFASNGIEESRIIIKSTIDRGELLNGYNQIDIVLDTFPSSGAIGLLDALIMGVPVITVESDRWSGRMLSSLLRSIGCSELIAANTEEYIDKACSLTHDRQRLEDYRLNLRTKIENSPQSINNYVKTFEGVLHDIWQRVAKQYKSES
ncbi:MAG: hypothetical protein LW817_00365 [Candidatus Caenarcaniphilales bacterium]|jgi:predicted O-linked N-acetylglucosamine transferase (SPINDLY family)|nr:hypothetical protein [Candidatus Caenarcaniphilales bacterium]